jgi:cytochrome o ubiquinol oxidase operon protein cyoD
MTKHHLAQPEVEISRGSLKSYTIGFVLSILFTLFAYFLVVNQTLSATTIMVAILVLAITQMLVQLVFFLHLGQESKPRWNLIVLLFALLVVLIVVIGSIWIMNNLNTHQPSPADLNSYIIKDEGISK